MIYKTTENTTKNYYSYPYETETYDKEHKHFGGFVYPSDFNTYFDTNYREQKSNAQGSTIAGRIAADLRWEENLKRVAKTQADLKKNKKVKDGDADEQQ